ncbi:RNA:NAD 2'-phosphotransferase [Saprospira grandis DSM 2844]|uniref:Probable RNA 2'-phosphotransferase n=1 Tax=Saprospira grandis DSM 2844 TaxID=694433 RepID=J0NXI2_9BACT|nr:RNA 2'-phosphotransferase [Saprospira grandis]EJF52204.1 RNA:NAD 2'-phosphotransferase [Saprospira grandis DSM 2844]
MSRRLVKTSKFLSLILRHRPELLGLSLEAGGWLDVEQLLAAAKAHNKELDRELLEEVVCKNNKKRFAFNAEKTKIRASQGHSVDIELGYRAQAPPEILYHGTAQHFLDNILKEGLLKMDRHQVHLSADISTAENVGRRHGKLVLLVVQAQKMQAAGYAFYQSANGVWLTDTVPPEYLQLWAGGPSA